MSYRVVEGLVEVALVAPPPPALPAEAPPIHRNAIHAVGVQRHGCAALAVRCGGRGDATTAVHDLMKIIDLLSLINENH